MSDDFQIIDLINRETSIKKLRTLFIQTVHQHETQLVEINDTNSQHIDLLQQQLSDSQAAVKGLNDKIKELKKMQEEELDLVRVNERELQSLLSNAMKENSELKSKLEKSEKENQKMISELNEEKTSEIYSLKKKVQKLAQQVAFLKEEKSELFGHFQQIKEEVHKLQDENDSTRKIIQVFIDATDNTVRIARHATNRACKLAKESTNQINTIYDGLVDLKNQVREISIERPKIPKFNFRSFKIKALRMLEQSVEYEKLKLQKESINQKGVYKTTFRHSAEELLDEITALKLINIKNGSSVRLFVNMFKQSLDQLKTVSAHFLNTIEVRIQVQKEKYKKKIRVKDQEIRTLKNEIELLKKERAVAKEKKQNSTLTPDAKKKSMKKSYNTLTTASLGQTSIISPAKPILVHVGILARTTTPNVGEMHERSLRHSKEAELQCIKDELKRAKDQNSKYESQIAGLRKMIKRQGETITEENGKSRQAINDLESQLREEKRIFQRKKCACIKLQQENEQLVHDAAKVDPLKKVILQVFKNCYDRLEPLIAEQSISDELSELDELSQELFNVPIHKICNPSFSRGYLKKQERKLATAISNSIEISEIVKVFDSLLSELQSRLSRPLQQ